MDDLISRGRLSEKIRSIPDISGLSLEKVIAVRDVLEMVQSVPAVDAAPVVPGHWVDHSAYEDGTVCRECSECHDMQIHYNTYYPNYCPNCGAKMDSERRESE